MQFDFEQFTKRFKRAYPVAEYARRKRNGGSDCGLFAYDDALEVFREYFLAYEYYTGTAHPQLKRERIIDIIQRMDGRSGRQGTVDGYNRRITNVSCH